MNDNFDEILNDILTEMQDKRELIPFLESLGGVMTLLADELHNEIVKRHQREDDEDEEDEDAGEDEPAPVHALESCVELQAIVTELSARVQTLDPEWVDIETLSKVTGGAHDAVDELARKLARARSFAAARESAKNSDSYAESSVSDLIEYLSQIRDDDGDGAVVSLADIEFFLRERT